MPKIYKARLEYQTPENIRDNHASSSLIMFESDCSGDDLIVQVMRWFINRKKAVPEIFSRLCAVDVWGQSFKQFDEDGYLPSNDAGLGANWKIDGKPIPSAISIEDIGWWNGSLSHLARVMNS